MKNAIANKNVANALPPVHPGKILAEEFLSIFNMSARALAAAIDVTPARVSDIIAGRRGITADTALRLGRYFGTTAQVWLNLQTNYDLAIASVELAETIEHIRPRAAGPDSSLVDASASASCNDKAPASRRGLFNRR